MVFTKLINLRTFDIEPFVIGQMPPYVATSHVWSENLYPVSSISSISTTTGMRMVSRALQDFDDGAAIQYCWVDTWCIDQNDPDDKFRQIPLMGDIYRAADGVIITVGYAFSFSQAQWDAAISACREILEVQRLPGPEYQASERRMGCLTIPSVKSLFQAYAMLIEFASLPWAGRIWTAQEFILAKSEVWIGLDYQPLRISLSDMTTLFTVRWFRCETLRLFESYIGVPQDFSAIAEDAAENLDLMNRIKEGRVPAIKIMLLAGSRKCTVAEDQIYGLMGASGVVFVPSKTETLESAWTRWWEESLKRGNLFYALLPVLELDKESVQLETWNCIMPLYDKRCDLGTKSVVDNANSWGETSVENGAINVMGKNAGTCCVDKYLCDNEIPRDLDGISKLCGHDKELTLKICLAVDMNQRTRDEIATAVNDISAYHQLTHSSRKLDEEETQTLRRLEESFRPPRFNVQCYTKIYLGRVKNRLKTTDILVITGEELPTTGKLLALDLIKKTDSEHPTKQLMVVRVPDNDNLPLHKVGMTYPVQFHEMESDVADCSCCGHVHAEPFQRYRIGGSACEFCNWRRSSANFGT